VQRARTLNVGQRAQLLGDPVPAHIQVLVVFIDLFRVVVHDTGEVARGRGGEQLPHLLLQRFLVAFEPEHVMTALGNDICPAILV